jgi:multidrug resistance efflux pump
MALVDTDTTHVEGYFEETKLPRIHVGDRVKIRLMGDKDLLNGHVESIAAGIEDRDRSDGSSLMANVNPTFNWVRLAQRVPVRIALDDPKDPNRLVVGRSATVEVVDRAATTSAAPDTIKKPTKFRTAVPEAARSMPASDLAG